MIGWLVGWLVGWLAGWLAGYGFLGRWLLTCSFWEKNLSSRSKERTPHGLGLAKREGILLPRTCLPASLKMAPASNNKKSTAGVSVHLLAGQSK